MQKSIATTLMILLFSMVTNAQSKRYDDCKKQWNKVEQFELKGLPKSALAEVEKIYKKAKKKQNHPQLIKSLLYKSKFALIIEENAQLNVINQLKAEIAANSYPTKNILESILANLYWQYFQQNRWKFYNRSNTTKKVDSVDFRTWDSQTIFEETHQHYQNSLLNALQLQQTDLSSYNDILNLSHNSKKFRPTLYDFLVHRAIDFYKNDERNLKRPAYKFEIKNPSLLDDNDKFAKEQFISKDSLSQQLHALKLYKNLTLFHSKDKDPSALVEVTLNRLHFVKENADFTNKNEIYLKTLRALFEKHKDAEVSTEISYSIASLLNEQGNEYTAKEKEQNRWKKKEALTICEEAISKFPKSIGAQKCRNLQQQILNKSLEIKNENFVPINQHSRLLVEYKNFNKLYFKTFKISEKKLQKFNEIYNDSTKIAFIKKLKLIKKWDNNLRNEKDYQKHSTEIIAPKLPNGSYLLVASNNNELTKNTIYATSYLQATNLVLIENKISSNYIYQIVDRYNGKPISKAIVHIKNHETDRYNTPIEHKLTTNNKGQVSFKVEKGHQNVIVTVNHGNDKATFGNYYLNKGYKSTQKNKDNGEIFLFTDRSIYRPGQTVYFKGVAIIKKTNKSEVLVNKSITVKLKDINYQAIKTLELKTNEFGSFSGSFILPSTGLTGNFHIRANGKTGITKHLMEGSTYFSVEEYKRPKFETEFKPVTETYKIDDSVTVKGFAKAYAGSNITDAKVVYKVRRTAQYPAWCWYYRPYFSSESQEITHGETTTDADGNFKITFKAQPDLSADKSLQPTFNYEVTADVTDLNGETRSTSTIVNVGYHALNVAINIADEIDKNKNQALEITTNNLNGEFVPTKGKLTIFKLKAPSTVLRNRPWQAPDYQDIAKDEFMKLFPHDAFAEEDNPQKWEKGELVFETDVDTEKSKKVDLNYISKWLSGKYVAEFVAKDKFNLEVKDEQRFDVFSNKDKTVADNQLFFIKTNQNTYKPEEFVKIQVGSASKDMTVTLTVEKNHSVVDTKIIKLSDEIKTIIVPVKEKDRGGFAINYQFVNYNSFENGALFINVPYPKHDLDIETSTFRDKLQPNDNETWSFKLKGNKKEKVAAEILASMYDASLDQFKQHQWKINPIKYNYYYQQLSSSANRSFYVGNFTVSNLNHFYTSPLHQNYDKFNWFGFNLINNWTNNSYLNKIKRKHYRDISISSKYDKTKPKGFIYGKVSNFSGILPGATVKIKGTTIVAKTDFDGYYSIKAKKGETLVFSFIGMKPTELKVQKNNIYNIILEDEDVLDEVMITAYGSKRNKISSKMTEKSFSKPEGLPDILPDEFVRSRTSTYHVNIEGIIIYNDRKISVEEFVNNFYDKEEYDILKIEKEEAFRIYGDRGKNGVLLIKKKETLKNIKARKNLQETAFFYPHLTTDAKGNVSFNFTVPESLTRWKLQLLAHTKDLKTATKQLTTVTQKELMVLPNPPRFFTEGDKIVFSAKIANLSDKNLNGITELQLFDALTNQPIDKQLGNTDNRKNFSVDAKGNTNVNWSLQIPDNVQAVKYKIVAKAGDFTDGEENALPVLSNRMLVTETLPMWLRSGQTKTFTLDKLKNNSSTTLKNHNLTLEITSNPAWYAVQALPYLMEYPYECAEQTFSRYYANALGSHIANSNPRIQEVFNQWKSSDALLSNLEKNQELKSLLIQETPWLRDAQSETEQKKRIALLLDLNKMKNELASASRKLSQIQMGNGGFPWFKGARYPNRYITQYIASGFGHLKKLNVISTEQGTSDEKRQFSEAKSLNQMMQKAINFLDDEISEDYRKLEKEARRIRESAKTKTEGAKKEAEFWKQNHTHNFQIQYLYMRSFYKDISIPAKAKKAVDYFTKQSYEFWQKNNLYTKGMIALIANRNSKTAVAEAILASLKENAVVNEELGMYWKDNTSSWYWYQAPIETQALMIEAFSEISNDTKTVDELKVWLLKNKQTNRWKTTKATSEAVYALLLQGTSWLEVTNFIDVQIGDEKINPLALKDTKVEAGTGYFKTSWKGTKIQPKMAEVKLSKKSDGIAWGALYWQYFEDLDKITSSETPLQLKKKLFLKKNTDKGEELSEITSKTYLNLGDLVRVRIELKVDRTMEFIHMKDMRAAGLEPVNVLSQYKWQDGLGYYESTKDAATNFFFDYLPKGVYVFEYDLRVNNKGDFSNGITTIQSMYAPEFNSHSEGVRIKVE